MGDAVGNVKADYIALRIDTEHPGQRGAWEIDGGEGPFVEQETMGDAIGIVKADDIALRAYTAGKTVCSAREINGGEVAFVTQEAMDHAALVDVMPDDVALGVNTEGKGERGSRGIYRSEGK